jgi:hypothetical protein
MENTKDNVSNDNTLKSLGFEYQKLWALKCCFEGTPNSTIYIESHGDVCDGNTTFEIKHHINRGNLTPQSVDFWKTLKNLAADYEVLSHCSRFILKTTQAIFRDEKWKNWNSISCKEKLALITALEPCASIKDHHKKVFATDTSILLSILSKFEIIPDSDNALELLTNLELHNTLKTIPEQNRIHVLKELIGYITKCTIDNPEAGWQVDINSFINELQRLTRIYNSTKIQFPREDKVILDDFNLENYIFIKQLKEIEYHTKVESAAQDFFRSGKSRIRLLETFPNLAITLDDYDEDISDELVNIRIAELDSATDLGIPHEKRHHVAKQVFNKCMSIPLREINGTEGTVIYYQRGRMHSFVENNEFHWTVAVDEF